MIAALVFDGADFRLLNSPTAPTMPAGDSSRRQATTEFVANAAGAVAAAGRSFRYLDTSTATALTANAVYLVNTTNGPVTAPLPAAPALGDLITFIDAANVWAVNNFTLLRNGKTIMGQAQDMTCDIANAEFSIRWSGTDWRLV